ncbi:MAG: ABC transporter ATP-binding protein [Clostridia bacterium]|nr:ABC transporter ATP-binding protein [Clostridia bacterium]
MKIRVTKSYGEKRVFDGFALDIRDGEVLCLLGRSGVGKTTLLKILAGSTDFDGEIDGAPDKVGFVFQEPRLLPHVSVVENLRYTGADEAEIQPVLEKVGLIGYADTRADKLSGGEKQRVAIARAFLSNAPLMLLDEPFSSLDLAWKVRLWQTFATLWEEKKPTTVLVTHDIEDAWALGHRIVLIRDGEIALDMRPKRTDYPAPYGEISKEKSALIQAALKGV